MSAFDAAFTLDSARPVVESQQTELGMAVQGVEATLPLVTVKLSSSRNKRFEDT